MKCSDCIFWHKCSNYTSGIPNYGRCTGIQGDRITIYIEAGSCGGYVSEIETLENFFCAEFVEIEKAEES